MDLSAFEARWTGHVPKPMGNGGSFAVLVPLVRQKTGLSLLFEVRASSLHQQPGEVCFPGGRMEAGETPVQCALRETEEELGLSPEQVRVIGPMDFLVHQSGFLLYPVLAEVQEEALSHLTLSQAEVAETFLVPVDWFLSHPPERYACRMIPQLPDGFPYERIGFPQGYPWRQGKADVPIYSWPEHPVWGITGRIVAQLLDQ